MSRDFPFMLSLSKHSEAFFSNLLADSRGYGAVSQDAADWLASSFARSGIQKFAALTKKPH